MCDRQFTPTGLCPQATTAFNLLPSGDETHQYWKNWSTRDELRSLARPVDELLGLVPAQS